MKIRMSLVAFALLAAASVARADLLFSDNFNYPDGLIETDGVWYVYSPAVPHLDAFVTNQLLILDQNNYDAVAAPFVNNTGSTIVYASFNINVSTLPTTRGGYFCQFKDDTNNYVCRIFINRTGTQVPGTYRLGVANFANSITTGGATNFPMDLATGITYQVVFSYDTDQNSSLAGATLSINPASESDFDSSPAYGRDTTTSPALLGINISQIALSQYTGQGVAQIGNVMVGSTYSDVVTNAPLKPVIGIGPQDTNMYSGNDLTLYVAASGTGQLTYQWLGNDSPLSDGPNTTGSTSNILTLHNLQSTAGYSVIVTGAGGSVTSQVATVTVDTTPTTPFFTLQPEGATNALGATITLTAMADGTGPMSYQWYFEATNSSSFTPLASGTGPTLTLTGVTYGDSGSYYVTATGGAGNKNSDTNSVLVTPPPLVPISYLHSLVPLHNSGNVSLNNGQVYTVEGVVTSFGPFSANGRAYAEFYIQDETAGIFVYSGTAGTNAVPPPGALVSVTGPATLYSGQLEIDPDVAAGSNSVTVLSLNKPMPAPQLLDFQTMAVDPLGAYGVQIQGSLVTVTNAYFYANNAGGAISGTFYPGGYTTFWMTEGPYGGANTNFIEVFVPAYGGETTNFWGQPKPSHAYEVTGLMAIYSGAGEFDPTRLVDFVTNLPPSFTATLTMSNGVPQLSWPAVTGSTYSVYGAASLDGPWTQAFGLGYYPSVGAFSDTNAGPMKFYRVSSP